MKDLNVCSRGCLYLNVVKKEIMRKNIGNLQETADLVIFTEEILNRKLIFLCSKLLVLFRDGFRKVRRFILKELS